MTTLNTLALIAHVLIAASIIGLVMLQKGKGADAGAGFGSETNKVTLVGADGSVTPFPVMSKRLVAQAVFNHLAAIFRERKTHGKRRRH